MAANATESDLSSLTSTKTVFHGDAIRSTASFSSELSSSQHSSTALLSGSSATLHNDVPSTSILQDSLASSHSAFSTVYHASSQSVSSTSQPLSTSATPPLTSVKEPYETSNYKISSHSSSPVKSSGIDSVQLTSNISPSSSVIYPSSSYIPPLLPITTAATNGSVSSTPSSLTDNLTLILGMSLCGVGLLILLIIVLFVCCKKRSTTKQQTVETVQIGDLWASNRGDISYAPTFDSVLDTVSESPKVQNKTSKDVLYHVLYPYTAQDDSQLNLDLGDVVTLVEKRGNGWWKGRIKDKEGWFPGSYVEETGIGKVYTSNHHLLNGHSPVSSFLKNQDLTPKLAKSTINRNSAPVFSFDKRSFELWEELKRVLVAVWSLGKEVSIPKVPTPTSSPYQSPPASKPTSPSHIPHSYGKVITENVGGRRFYALYSHEPNFSNELQLDVGDVVIGIERDMNGWMKGRKKTSEEIGMFPAIYVQEISQNEEPLGYKDKQSVYDQLPVCNNDLSTAEYIGVEHTAVCPYAAENDTDLSFDIGDTIIVCQTLDNGWWYGCYDDQFGWFPGSYVEMCADEIDGPVSRDVTQEEEKTHDDIPDKIVIHDIPLETTIDKDIAALSPIKPLGGHRSEDEISQKSTESLDQKTKVPNGLSKDSPNKRSKLPKSVRPSRPAPPPPIQHHSTPESKSNLMDKFNKAKVNNSVNKNNSQIGKPEVPKRYIKPKLRKVPKTKTKAGNESELCRRKVRSPPPPRPDPPKLLKEKYMIRQEKANSVYPDLKDVNSTPNVSQTDVDTSNTKYANETRNESQNINNESAILPDDTQNVTSFLENTATTDTSIGKMSGLTSLSSSVQGDRTHDQSELTSVSAINMSDMNDSRQLVNRQNSMDNSQSDERSATIGNQNVICEPSVEHNAAKQAINGDILDHQNAGNQKLAQKPDSRLPCKLPQPKSHSMRDDSPKPTLIPKSQSLRSDGPKPPPVAPKPNKNHLNSQYDGEPGYSEVGTSLVGEDVADNPDKISFYQRPLSPIYSKIDKKYIVPNQKNSVNSKNMSFDDPELNNEQKLTNEIIDNKGTGIDNHIQENGLKNAHIIDDSDQKMAVISGSLSCDATEKSSVSGPQNVSENRPSQDNGPKTSSIPGPAHSYQSNIPKRLTSPAVKNKQLHGNSSIPKPNFSPTSKTHTENVEENEYENKSKPERPSRPPNVVRHSSMTSPSPSRLPKVEKSKSLLSDSPNMSRKFQRQKAGKESSKIPSAIPKSPKQKAPIGSSRTASSPSRLPRKAMNGIVSPKPKRPPPPKTPPTSPVTDSPTAITFSPNYSTNHTIEDGHLQINDTDNRQNAGSLLKKAITSYTAQNEDELSFQEGSFIQEISQDDESGICVGMLPNGDTGLYHRSFVEDSCHEQHSVV